MSSLLDEHLNYVSDSQRLQQFKKAIERIVKPGNVVADLGCGTGILGLLCLQAGAAKVYAIDSGPMIEVARQSLRQAGFGEYASFIQGKSSQIELPELMDVVICDHVGYFGFDYGIIDFLQDARKRFLKPDGALIPSSIRLHIAPVSSQKCIDGINGWQSENIPESFHWLRNHAVNSKHGVNFENDEVLGASAVLDTIDLYRDQPDFYSWTSELTIERTGRMDGLAGWFECELAQDVWMTNSPLSENSICRPQAFLPIEQSVEVKPGDRLNVMVMVRLPDHLIAWTVAFPENRQRFSHSTWHGELLTGEQLIRLNPAHIPKLSPKGRATALVLAYCDGQRTAQEIEQAVLYDHPDLFPSADEISRFVAQVLGGNTT